jgi:Flp pilus assembly protein TadD
MTESSLEQQALSQLNSGHYKEAIGLYKKLMQTSDKEEWIQQIAYCYLQRALSFAARNMVKEALVLWENYAQHAQPPYDAYDHYISWLIESKNPEKIHASLQTLSIKQLDKQYPELAALLGFLMITDHPEFQQYLAQESALISHFQIVQTALQAYQDNNKEKVTEVLKKLPYRSAFRDFRTLLNAVVVIPNNNEEGQILLARIPANSPYRQIARLLLACTKEGAELAEGLLKFNYKQRNIIGDIKGLKKKQLELIDQLVRHKDHLSNKVKFNLAIKYKLLLGSDLTQQFCQAMLVDYPAGRRDFNKKFSSINEFEGNRLSALTCERDNNFYDAEYYWKQCVELLINEEADNDLKIALILRHIAVQQPETDEQIELLIESLAYDPEDRECYLQILHNFSQENGTAKDYKHWLAKTLDKFPQDIDVLTQAIKTATHNKTYKKACQYALKILKIDPINTFAKQVLFSSHIAHARRLILEKKYHLVEKEIQQAEDLHISKAYNMQTQLMRGFFCFVNQDKKQGLQIIVESLTQLNSDPVNAHFQATMEAQLTGMPVATILRELPAVKDYLQSIQELDRLIQQIQGYAYEVEYQALLHKSLEKIKSVLKKSMQQQDITENLLLSLCQTLSDINHFELIRHCAKQALLKWQKPIWEYYKVYSETNGMPERSSHSDIMRLDSSREQAMHNKDHRAMVLIDSFLDHYYLAHPQRNMGFMDELFGAAEFDQEDDDFEDPLDTLFSHLPEKVLIKLDKKLEVLFKKTSPEMLVEQLQKVIGDDKNLLSAMMQEPDLFTALLMLTAADELGLDINVSVGDVLECFGIDKQTDLFSFPF